MTSPGTTPDDLCGDAGPLARAPTDQDLCPLCGEPITFAMYPDEDGFGSWFGECVTCNTIVEAL